MSEKDAQAKNDDDALYQAMEISDWVECRRLLTDTIAPRLVRRYHDLGGVGLRHAACFHDVPLDVLRTIYEIDPERARSRKEMHTDGYLLSHACHECTVEEVDFLLTIAPGTATYNDYWGRLPLHHAVELRRSPALLRRLLEDYPDGVHAKNDEGKTPLHRFVEVWEIVMESWDSCVEFALFTADGGGAYELVNGSTVFLETLLVLLMAHVHGGLMDEESDAYRNDWFPVHEALKMRDVMFPSIFHRSLLENLPKECFRYDRNRNFPLHLACRR